MTVKNIVGIDEAKFGMSLAAFGLERLCMAINGLSRVQDVDYILPSLTQAHNHGTTISTTASNRPCEELRCIEAKGSSSTTLQY